MPKANIAQPVAGPMIADTASARIAAVAMAASVLP
jgi:hypothetical protein